MNENRNMILAMVLSALVLFGWSMLSDRFFPTAAPQTQKVEDGKVTPAATPPAAGTAAPQALRNRAQVIAETPRVRFQTPALSGSINLKGARIDDLVLLKHRMTFDPNSSPVPLLNPQGTRAASFVGFGWTGNSIATPGPDTVWQASAPALTPGKPVTLSWMNPTGQTFEIILSIDDLYLFNVAQRVVNRSSNAVTLTPYGFASRAGRSMNISSWTIHVGPISVRNDKADYDVDWSSIRDAGPNGLNFAPATGWIGFTDLYWLTALAPKSQMTGSFVHSANGAYQANFSGRPQTVAPGQIGSFETRVFSGAKEIAALDRYQDAGIPLLSKAVDWGWFEWFMIPIHALLEWLFRQIGNFGVAIICLTLIVRLLLFPVAQKQFASMGAMRKVQPKLKALQERYKDDKPRLQQEMMKLYKEEKINPAAGCLPILLQIPIFYALYKVLLVSVEMRHQPFALWIKDLSAPDPLTPLNLFGYLNFTPPAVIAIGILPLLLGVTMWMQFKLNPAQPDPVQQQIFSIMPWVMMFVMAPFAAGLMVYWITNNILSIGQQWWLYRKYGLHLSDTHPATT
ncbi:membrane protein insertase YidC [Sphingomonas piscis]|uniref:Membrane protein insertase YidC n=1 Tax=Sphingomonas piscis TaxID=2714943 RepID=A0A6G7YLN4_9SPHN|nr:membrane protein insertase YidC [Sphingomonas piscis]QIK77653.1 membrane protein insertase YidC [Sphingomonas piscis]